MEVTFNPSEKHLSQIKEWLLEEYQQKVNGFSDNFFVIKQEFIGKRMLCLVQDGIAIGYLVYSVDSYKSVKIKIANIKVDFINKGFGKVLLNSFESFLIEKNIYVIELDSTSEESKKIWKKLGFKESDYKENNPSLNCKEKPSWLYKIICDSLEPSNEKLSRDYIELWDSSDSAKKSIVFWNLHFEKNSNKLINPIIYPVHFGWNIKYVKSGDELYNGNIKGLLKKFKKGIFGESNFLIIEDLS